MTPDALADQVRLVLEGNTEAFEQLYNATITDVYRTLYMLCGSERDAEDVTQQVYLEMYRSLAQYDEGRSFRGWMYGITIRQYQSYKRKLWREQRKRRKQWEMRETGGCDLEYAVLQQEQRDRINTMLHQLPDKYRELLVLRYINELSQQDIAEALAIPIGTVKSRLNQALKHMRKLVRRDEYAET